MVMMSIKVAKDVIGRIIALFLVSSVGAITSSSVMNQVQSEVQVPLWYAAWMAGLMAIVTVVGDTHGVSAASQLLHQVRADEARAARHQIGRHVLIRAVTCETH